MFWWLRAGRGPHADTHASSNHDPHTHTDTDTNTHTHTHTDTHTNADPDTNTHAHADTDTDTDAKRDGDTNADTHATAVDHPRREHHLQPIIRGRYLRMAGLAIDPDPCRARQRAGRLVRRTG
jgi:hypothetical protein